MVAGGFNLGNAFGRVVIDPSGVDSGMAQARQAFDNGLQSMGAGLQNLGSQITGIGGRLTLLTAPLTLFGKQGLDAASNFQDAMTEIQVRARLSADEMERVRQKALEMGADTVFSAGQSAEAFLQLLTTGQSVEEAMQTIGAVMAGAAASGSDLGYVADAVTDIMAQFNLTADKSSNVVNALARAAGASSATMDDLIQGFQNVGGVANSFNLSIDDTAAILATFSENGIKGAEAGTQLRSMLNNMMRPTDNVQKAWQRLGTSMFDSTGKMRPLNAVIADINKGMANMTEQERLETIQALAGTYGQLGLTALLNADGFGAMAEAMNDASDAQDVADAKMKTFSGSVENLRGSIETLQINALTPLMDRALSPMIRQVTDLVNKINDWVVANPELADQILRITAGLVVAGPALVGVGQALNIIGGAIKGFGLLLGLITSPIALVVGAIAGIAFLLDRLGVIDLGGIIETVSTAFGNFFGALQNGVDPVYAFLNLIGDLFGTDTETQIITWLQSVADWVHNVALPALRDLARWFLEEALPAVVGFITGTVIPAIQDFFGFLGRIWSIVGPALGLFARWFLEEALPAVADFITGTVIPAVERFIGILVRIWNDVSPFLINLARWFIEDALPAVIRFINEVAIPIIQDVIGWLQEIWTAVEPYLVKLYNWFVTEALPGIIDFLNNTVTPIINDFITLLKNIWEQVSPVIDKLVKWFTVDGLPGIVSYLQNFFFPPVNDLITLLSGIWDNVKTGVENLKTGLNNAFNWIKQNVIQPAIDRINDLIEVYNRISGVFGGPQIGFLGGPELITGGKNPALSGGTYIPGVGLVPYGSQDSGGRGAADIPYLIGKGAQPELFVPDSAGTFYPNADRLMGGDTYNVSIVADSYEGGAAAARGFEDEMRFRRRSRG